jgi:hypothetical protein
VEWRGLWSVTLSAASDLTPYGYSLPASGLLANGMDPLTDLKQQGIDELTLTKAANALTKRHSSLTVRLALSPPSIFSK